MRILIDGAATGQANMRRDLALLAEGKPTVRLYAWKPACVSLGLPQPESDIDLGAVQGYGYDVVRRPTGGGAILHAEDEVTYSVIMPRRLVPGTIFDSYKQLAGGLVTGLQELGVQASFMEGKSGRDALCYLREEGVSIGVNGLKISGGAQKRTKDAVLQHGTLLCSTHAEANAAVFRTTPERVRGRVTSLSDLGVNATRTQVHAALVRGFTRSLAPTVLEDALAANV